MKNLLQTTKTYSFFDYEEMMHHLTNKLSESTTEFNVQKQISDMKNEQITIWILTVVEDYI